MPTELQADEATAKEASREIYPVEFGSENTYYTDDDGNRCFSKNYPPERLRGMHLFEETCRTGNPSGLDHKPGKASTTLTVTLTVDAHAWEAEYGANDTEAFISQYVTTMATESLNHGFRNHSHLVQVGVSP